jgi:glycosyltransferase involved in cell wall biosynthesis
MIAKQDAGGGREMKKLAILVNLIAPYRLPVFALLAQSFETLILHGGAEPNRTWALESQPALNTHKVFTLQIPMRKKIGVSGVSDTSYVHINLGLLWWLPRFRPDVILSNEMGLRTVAAICYGKLVRVPVWVWWGGTLHSERNITKLRYHLRRAIVGQVDRWVSYGATTTEYLESLGIRRNQILQIQNCVPHETFMKVPSNPAGWFKGEPRPVIITVGQLVPRKGLDKLIEACGRLADRGCDFTLTIVGQGPERERLVELAKQNRIEHFLILPNQPQPVLNEIYRAADVFVLPTLEDVWGLVVNEAMWAGAPVLCSKYAGCAPELLSDSNIFDPMSPQSFDAALAKIFDHSVCPPDQSRLKTWQEVGEMISRSLHDGSPVC